MTESKHQLLVPAGLWGLYACGKYAVKFLLPGVVFSRQNSSEDVAQSITCEALEEELKVLFLFNGKTTICLTLFLSFCIFCTALINFTLGGKPKKTREDLGSYSFSTDKRQMEDMRVEHVCSAKAPQGPIWLQFLLWILLYFCASSFKPHLSLQWNEWCPSSLAITGFGNKAVKFAKVAGLGEELEAPCREVTCHHHCIQPCALGGLPLSTEVRVFPVAPLLPALGLCKGRWGSPLWDCLEDIGNYRGSPAPCRPLSEMLERLSSPQLHVSQLLLLLPQPPSLEHCKPTSPRFPDWTPKPYLNWML